MNQSIDRKRKISLIATTIAVGIVALELFEDDEKGKNKRGMLEHMKNIPKLKEPSEPLEKRIRINDFLKDPARGYCKIFTSLEGWEFFTLADHLSPSINSSRANPNNLSGSRIKFDHYNRLYFTLYWLTTGAEYRQMEFYFGWCKSSWDKEIQHVLSAIIKGLDCFLQWPNSEERAIMANRFSGIFKGCIGIIDAWETPIMKPKIKNLESTTYSGKQRTNTLKTLAVIDRDGRFRFLHAGTPGGINDRDQFTHSLLYLNKQEFFDDNQFIVGDGIYRGDGPILTSYNASQLRDATDPCTRTFNVCFTDFRKGVENAFGRVQNWFPLLGNKINKWCYEHYTLVLAIHAAARLHNWMLHIRGLNYDPTMDPSYLFTSPW